MAPKRILVIDDNKDLADGLSELMEMYEHKVDIALNGGDGIAFVEANHYDVIFVDVGLPDINGVECARRIRENGSSARIVLMTGYSAQDIPAQLDDLGETKLLTKPIDPLLILAQAS